jgi:hypothetical protein
MISYQLTAVLFRIKVLCRLYLGSHKSNFPPNRTSRAAVFFGTADVFVAAFGLNEGQLS